eukprot:355173-Chlamydomonas_euryale.AAC.1
MRAWPARGRAVVGPPTVPMHLLLRPTPGIARRRGGRWRWQQQHCGRPNDSRFAATRHMTWGGCSSCCRCSCGTGGHAAGLASPWTELPSTSRPLTMTRGRAAAEPWGTEHAQRGAHVHVHAQHAARALLPLGASCRGRRSGHACARRGRGSRPAAAAALKPQA